MEATASREILIFSDTHGNPSLMREALARHPDADVIHLGDGIEDMSFLSLGARRIFRVRGNFEDFAYPLSSRRDAPPAELMLDAGGLTLMLTHGHTLHVKYGMERAISHATAAGADVLLYGHTHRPDDTYLPAGTDGIVRPLRLFNPGSAGTGMSRSYGLLTHTGDNFIFSHVLTV